uniref:Small ribosomal subunit protein uS3c n=1 Tax=Eustigmatophyceae sp. Chic 10/23 P-6w TaxID=1446905 RepID=A0A3R5T8P6_9STRA|nr:ribosomal protein S3 [Eustigmatophyceae sp. Chic 10/23 P-6w]QAA11532.1 ribosomal protein S3 [Eustigmatophyceae sp. Chic 10/23 P-6w]
MGQKVHPIGFRIGITKEHASKWYAKSSDYASVMKADDELREKFVKFLNSLSTLKQRKAETIDLSKIAISYPATSNQIYVIIYSVSPAKLKTELSRTPINIDFSKFLRDHLSTRELIVKIKRLRHPYTEPGILAQSLTKKLEKRMPFRRAIRSAMKDFKEAARRAKLKPREKGIKIQIAGRLNGAEIARSEWVRQGRVPLHTIQADVGYISQRAQTIYGTLGVKIWVCKR